jgi:hypothetical protein
MREVIHIEVTQGDIDLATLERISDASCQILMRSRDYKACGQAAASRVEIRCPDCRQVAQRFICGPHIAKAATGKIRCVDDACRGRMDLMRFL